MAGAICLCTGCIFEGKHEFAISRCDVCEKFFCKRHEEQHAQREGTSSHCVSPIDDDATQACPQSPAAVKCADHPGKDIEGFCDTCNIVICGSCCLGDHRGHKYRLIAEVAAEKRAEVTKINDTLAVYHDALATSIMHLDKSEADNNVSTVVAIESVKELFIKVRAIVDVAEAQATLDVKTMSKNKNKMQLGGQRLGVEFHQCEVDNLQNVVTTALASDNDAEFLQLCSNIAPRFAAIQQDRSSWVLEPCTNGNVYFVPVVISIGKMGHVVDGDCDNPAAFRAELKGDAHERVVTIVAVEKTRRTDEPWKLLDVTHISPSGVSQSLPVTSAAVGTCSATLSLVDDGDHVVNVRFANTHVAGSPIRFHSTLVRYFLHVQP